MLSLLKTKTQSVTVCLCLLFSVTIFTGCNPDSTGENNFSIPGVDGPTFSNLDDGMLVDMVFENLAIDGGLRYHLPDYKNSFISLLPDIESGGTILSLYISYEDIWDNDEIRLLDPHKLPGGQPIPGLRGGRLPGLAFQVAALGDMGFYLGIEQGIYGIWIPVDLGSDVKFDISYRFYSDDRHRVGAISMVGPNSDGEHSGFFIGIDLNSDAAKITKSRAGF